RLAPHPRELLHQVEQISPVPIRQGLERTARIRLERKRMAYKLLPPLEEFLQRLVSKPIEDEHLTPGQQRSVELEGRVLGRGPDQYDRAVLYIRQKAVLLSPVESVDLIDEQQRALAGLASPAGG